MINPERIWKSPDLPTLPTVAVRLLELSKDVESEITDFVAVLRTDPAISTRLIKAANSSYFGFPSKVTSVEGAVPLLGTTVVTSLALSFSLVLDSDGALNKEDYTRFWSRSVLQAVCAEYLANEFKLGPACEFFLAGLLSDVGALAQMRTIPYAYADVLRQVREEQRSLLEVERSTLGFDHVEIGCRLMQDWKMPDELADSVKYHHASLAELKPTGSLPHASLLRATRFASCVGEYFDQECPKQSSQQLSQWGQLFFGLEESSVQTLLQEVRDRTAKVARLMSIDATNLPQPSDLLARANAQLADIALREHVAKVEVAAKTTALEQQNKDLQERAKRLLRDVALDSLTGVANRRAFDENFEQMLSVCLGQGRPAGVIFADVDNFKKLNDTHGHPFGDLVLQRIAHVLKQVTRESDLIARYGGEEFVVVIVNCPVETICSVAERSANVSRKRSLNIRESVSR